MRSTYQLCAVADHMASQSFVCVLAARLVWAPNALRYHILNFGASAPTKNTPSTKRSAADSRLSETVLPALHCATSRW